MSELSDDETGEQPASGVACTAPCPENDGQCGLEVGHGARHLCATDSSHRWVTEAPA